MKRIKKRAGHILASAAAAAVAAVAFGTSAAFATEGAFAATASQADGTTAVSVTGEAIQLFDGEAMEFLWTADLQSDGGRRSGLVFGAQADSSAYYFACADFTDDMLHIGRYEGQSTTYIASLPYGATGTECTLTLEVRGDTAYLTADETYSLICTLDGYNGGLTGLYTAYGATTIDNSDFTAAVYSATYGGEGDVALDLGNYTVQKVVNVTDGSRRLGDGDYAVQDSRLVLKASYLSTLASGTEYVIRAVTAERDLDFYVTASFAGASATAEKTQVDPSETIRVQLTGATSVYEVRVDGTAIDGGYYSYSDGVLSISTALGLMHGEHRVEIVTDRGRPVVEITVAQAYISEDAEEEPNFVFFAIDITIFAVFIIACIAGPIVSKKLKKAEA